MNPHLFVLFVKLTVECNHGGRRQRDFDMEQLAKLGLAEWDSAGVWRATEKGRTLVKSLCMTVEKS